MRACDMRVLTYVIVFSLLSLPISAHGVDSTETSEAKELSISLSFWTQHANPSDDTNDSTYLVAISYNDYIVSRFVNSYNNETYFAGKRLHTRRFSRSDYHDWYWQGNLYLGLMHGYEDELPNVAGISSGVFPTIGIGYNRTSVEVGYVPTPKGGVFMSMFRIALSTD